MLELVSLKKKKNISKDQMMKEKTFNTSKMVKWLQIEWWITRKDTCLQYRIRGKENNLGSC